MEEVIDFDKWFESYKPAEISYVAVYDPSTGAVKSVGPLCAFENEQYKIDLDKDLAESILTAEVHIHRCVVDLNSNKLEIAEVKSVNKIDDLLHRIMLLKDSDIKKPDVFLTYDSKNKTLKVQLSEEFGGTKKLKVEFKKRNFVWDGDTEMVFLITEYNDPNLIFKTVSVKLNELIGKSKTFKDIDVKDFSVYTRRLFNNYVIEIK